MAALAAKRVDQERSLNEGSVMRRKTITPVHRRRQSTTKEIAPSTSAKENNTGLKNNTSALQGGCA